MLTVAIFLFIIGAIFGAILLAHVLRDRPTPSPVVWMHGGFVLVAVLIVISVVASGQTNGLLLTSLGLFILAALGGLTMLTFDLSKRTIPKLIAVIHPLLAATALVLLIIYVLS